MKNTSFNSKLVRLKAVPHRVDVASPDKFQFHTGSIKSAIGRMLPSPVKGGFNSILVRLKDQEVLRLHSAKQGFNSILVRLKAWLKSTDPIGAARFQFHTGSIKSENCCRHCLSITRFNSILVRLKEEDTPVAKALRQFQFHTGSIKSKSDVVAHLLVNVFQFHTGSIKRFTCTDYR